MEAIVVAACGAVIAIMNYLRTRKVDKRMTHEFTNNGGSSARDVLDYLVIKVDNIEDKVDSVEVEQAKVRCELEDVKGRLP